MADRARRACAPELVQEAGHVHERDVLDDRPRRDGADEVVRRDGHDLRTGPWTKPGVSCDDGA